MNRGVNGNLLEWGGDSLFTQLQSPELQEVEGGIILARGHW